MTGSGTASASGGDSPLAFARAYQEYCREAAAYPFADSRLLLAAGFWSHHMGALIDPQGRTYRLQDIPPLLAEAATTSFDDLWPGEIEQIAHWLESLKASPDLASPDPVTIGRVWEAAARSWLYLGAVRRGLEALRRSGVPDIPGDDVFRDLFRTIDAREAIDLPGELIQRLCISGWLERFGAAWSAQAESGYPDTANCVVVEYDTRGKPVRGRLRRLTGRLDRLDDRAAGHEVILHHQVRGDDDPYVASVYRSLDVFASLAGPERSGGRHTYYRMRLSFDGADGETYSGDSIGMAAFAVAYGSRWSADLHWERRLVAANAAFTGTFDQTGKSQTVAGHSLAAKVRRVFCSPVQHLAVPEANRRQAEDTVAALRAEYPHRRLRIVGIERASDIIADHNILRSERICIAEFAVKAAGRMSRNVKIQVPVLLLLLYALVCIVEPRAWIWFDWNPHSVVLTTTGFDVLNSNEQKVWGKTFAAICDTSLSTFVVGDLDGDQQNEVAYMPAVRGSKMAELNARLHVYRSHGSEMFSQSAVIMGEYPGDTSLDQFYQPGRIRFVASQGGVRIVTFVTRSFPGRGHITFWDTTGCLQGWFINAGFPSKGIASINTSDSPGVYFVGYNNRTECVSFFQLSLDSSFGVSPPYDDPEYDLSGVQRGNPLAYILLPRTDLNRASRYPYNHPFDLAPGVDGQIEVRTQEFDSPSSGVLYRFSPDTRVRQVMFDDVFISTHDKLASRGLLSKVVDWVAYGDDLMDSVKYWTGSGWITEAELRRRTAP